MISVPKRIREYLAFADERPELFQTASGGVRILMEPEEILAVEAAVGCYLAKNQLHPDGARVGIVLRDPWFYVLRDAVEFPDGSRRMHARCINRVNHGVAVLPILDGRIQILRHFRHATRRWMWEIPRGGIEPGNSLEQAVRQELMEEMGAHATSIVRTGFAHGSSNLSYNGAHLHVANIDRIGEPQTAEGIVAIDSVSPTEFEAMIARGEVTDSITLAAYLQAKLQGLVHSGG